MIWADRLAIGIFLLTGGLIGLQYAFLGNPGTFPVVEEISAALSASTWFICRVADFIFTGRIRCKVS